VTIKAPKKLIEVALPLDDINAAAAREKSIRHGHPSTLHLWWARRPLAAARAVLFGQLVNDPGGERGWGRYKGQTKEDAQREREVLFDIIRDLVKWENTNNEAVLERAREAIRASWRETCELNKGQAGSEGGFDPDKLPAFHDPFAGGGAIPLEAQRLGLEAHASDLNPVAVLINKAMIEIPPKFAGRAPVGPEVRSELREARSECRALPRGDCLAEGDAGREGSVSVGAATSKGGDVRDAVANHARSGVDSGQYRRGMDAGVGSGKDAVSGDCTRFTRGDGDLADSVRANRLVPGTGNSVPAGASGRNQPNVDHSASQVPPVTLTSHVSPLSASHWPGATGLAEDVRRYGHWMREEAFKRIGHLYPPVEVTAEMARDPRNPRPDLEPYVGKQLTVIAWIWARTVKSPNPAYAHVDVPLASSFLLSTKKGKEAWVQPVIDGDRYRFEIRVGAPPAEAKDGTKLSRGANFRCLMSGAPIEPKYIKAEGRAGRMGARLMAIVAEGNRSRVYLPPTAEMENIAQKAEPNWKPDTSLPDDPRNFWTVDYGLTTFGGLFTPRQLVALNTFSDLVQEARERVIADAKAAGWADDGVGIQAGGSAATAYAEGVASLLAFSVSRLADRLSSICSWDLRDGQGRKPGIRNVFSRQAIPMAWDYAEANPLSDIAASATSAIKRIADVLERLPTQGPGWADQIDAVQQRALIDRIVATDPPYYDNIGYADLSDFFYVWLRHSLRDIYPELFATLAVPKAEELIASPYRHGGKDQAEQFFLKGMKEAISRLAEQANAAFPVTIYYAFKQQEAKASKQPNHAASDTHSSLLSTHSSTGWETFLDAVLRAGFGITGTWPMRTELGNRMIGAGNNALASSIVLVCRKRPVDAPSISRRQFLRQLDEELPEALEAMIGGREGATAIAPVDLAQAAIGPGMAIFSRYAAVLEADGSPMPVRAALVQINRAIDEYFTQAEGDMDADTRFCVDWFQQNGFKAGKFGEADVLARAKGTSVDGLKEAGVLESGGGKVRLYAVDEYPANWNPDLDARAPVWEACHQMARALAASEASAGALLARMPQQAEPIKQLAYRLYTLCERKGWADAARTYNGLVTSWPGIVEASYQAGHRGEQLGMDV
jgi:putative DNA methylase